MKSKSTPSKTSSYNGPFFYPRWNKVLDNINAILGSVKTNSELTMQLMDESRLD